jgi:hypothetical protein
MEPNQQPPLAPPQPGLLVTPLPPQPSTPWQHTKAWFHYSETLFLARLTMLSGFMIAAVGAMDWSPLTTIDFETGFKPHQLVAVGSITLVKGVVDEVARRRNSALPDGTGAA